jgi:hypothetical protein
MEILLVTYAVAWAAVSAYAAWLAIGSGRLGRRLERLESLIGEKPDDLTPVKRVA